MQIVNVTQSYVFSQACTYEILCELATVYCGYSQDATSKLAKENLAKGSAKRDNKSMASGDLPNAKLRTCVVQKLQDSQDYGNAFTSNDLQLEINCLPDTVAPKQERAASKELAGSYIVVTSSKLKCTQETDPGKWQIWQHVWACNTFEQYFATAPKKAVTRTGRIVTAASEIRWAVKCGWVKPVAA